MKRANEDVIGSPRLRETRQDVAGLSTLSLPSGSKMTSRSTASLLDVASFQHGQSDPRGTAGVGMAAGDSGLLADFLDFMAGDAEIERGEVAPPDPVFRERLRGRLWRTHVMTHLSDSGETH